LKKSPQLSASKKLANLKKVFNEKNAPKIFKVGGKTLFNRAQEKLKRKEIEILIETPIVKKEESKHSSVTASNASRRQDSAKKMPALSVSKSKERMKSLSKNSEEQTGSTNVFPRTNLKSEIDEVKRTGRKPEKEEIMKKPRLPLKSEKSEKSPSKSVSDKKLERSRSKDEKVALKKNLAKRSFPIKAVKNIKKEEDETTQVAAKKQLNNIQPTPIRKVVVKTPVKPKVEVKEEAESEESKPFSPIEASIIKKDYSASKSKERKLVKKPIKHQIGYNVDTKAISEEITKILKKIEDKKKKKPVEAEVPMKTSRLVKKLSAQDYGFKIKINPNFKPNHIVKIEEISAKPFFTNCDVLLTIIEIATNSEYYSISYNDRSRFFWEDVVKYEDLKNIFGEFKGETLRKYWKVISSIGDVNKTSDLVKKHKKLFDEIKMKLLPIIITIKKYLEGTIEDIEAFISNQTKEVRKTDLFEEILVDPVTGLKKEISYKVITTRCIKKYESKITHEYNGKNFAGPVEDVLQM